MVSEKVREHIVGHQDRFMRGTGDRANRMDMEYLVGHQDRFMRGIGDRANRADKER